MARVVVTGADGFIGRHLADVLTAAGRMVIPLGRREADVTDSKALLRLTRAADALVHLAFPTRADGRAARPLEALHQVAAGTINAMRLAAGCGVSQVVLASSGKVYGSPERLPIPEDHPTKPTTFLGELKCLQESILTSAVRSARLPVKCGATSLRLFNVYGPGQADTFAIPRLVSGVRSSGPLLLGELEHRRDWIHVSDACAAILAVIEHPPAPGLLRPLNAGTGRSASIREILELLGQLHEASPEVRQDPGLLRPDEEFEERADCPGLQALGWSVKVGLEQGLRSVWEAAS